MYSSVYEAQTYYTEFSDKFPHKPALKVGFVRIKKIIKI